MEKENINTAEYWDKIWAREIRKGFQEHDWTLILYGDLIKGDVMEIGGGVTHFQTDWIRRRMLDGKIRSYTNVDISPVAIERTLSHFPEAEGIVHNIEEKKPIPTEKKYDTIILAHSLEHITWDTAKWLVDELYRLLQPSGFIIAEVPPNDGGEHMIAFGNDDKVLRKLFEPKFKIQAIGWTNPNFVTCLIRK